MCRAASIAHRRAGGSGRGEFNGNSADVGCRNSADLLGPFRRVRFQQFLQFVNCCVGPLRDELFVVQILRKDRVAHRERDRSIGAGEWSEPFVAGSGSVRQPHVERDELRSVVEATILDSRCEGDVSLVSLERVRAKVQDVL